MVDKAVADLATKCGKHALEDNSTKAAFKACVDDEVNTCYVTTTTGTSTSPGWKCVSGGRPALQYMKEPGCSDSIMTEMTECEALSVDSCPKNPKCRWTFNEQVGLL